MGSERVPVSQVGEITVYGPDNKPNKFPAGMTGEALKIEMERRYGVSVTGPDGAKHYFPAGTTGDAIHKQMLLRYPNEPRKPKTSFWDTPIVAAGDLVRQDIPPTDPEGSTGREILEGGILGAADMIQGMTTPKSLATGAVLGAAIPMGFPGALVGLYGGLPLAAKGAYDEWKRTSEMPAGTPLRERVAGYTRSGANALLGLATLGLIGRGRLPQGHMGASGGRIAEGVPVPRPNPMAVLAGAAKGEPIGAALAPTAQKLLSPAPEQAIAPAPTPEAVPPAIVAPEAAQPQMASPEMLVTPERSLVSREVGPVQPSNVDFPNARTSMEQQFKLDRMNREVRIAQEVQRFRDKMAALDEKMGVTRELTPEEKLKIGSTLSESETAALKKAGLLPEDAKATAKRPKLLETKKKRDFDNPEEVGLFNYLRNRGIERRVTGTSRFIPGKGKNPLTGGRFAKRVVSEADWLTEKLPAIVASGILKGKSRSAKGLLPSDPQWLLYHLNEELGYRFKSLEEVGDFLNDKARRHVRPSDFEKINQGEIDPEWLADQEARYESRQKLTPTEELSDIPYGAGEEPPVRVGREPGEGGFARIDRTKRTKGQAVVDILTGANVGKGKPNWSAAGATKVKLKDLKGSGWIDADGNVWQLPGGKTHYPGLEEALGLEAGKGGSQHAEQHGIIRVNVDQYHGKPFIYVENTLGKKDASPAQLSTLENFRTFNPHYGVEWSSTRNVKPVYDKADWGEGKTHGTDWATIFSHLGWKGVKEPGATVTHEAPTLRDLWARRNDEEGFTVTDYDLPRTRGSMAKVATKFASLASNVQKLAAENPRAGADARITLRELLDELKRIGIKAENAPSGKGAGR
jgi:hypothetical protein